MRPFPIMWFVASRQFPIAPKVSGYIAEVLVSDNEPVKAGQLLARIDDRDFKTALNQAKADVAASEAAVKNLNAQYVGGLGAVSAALPRALRRQHDVRVLLPGYRPVLARRDRGCAVLRESRCCRRTSGATWIQAKLPNSSG